MKQEKLIRNASRMYVFANVLQKIVMAGLVMLVFAIVAMFFIPKDAFYQSPTSISFGELTLQLGENSLPAQIVPGRVTAGMIAVIVPLAFLWYGLKITKDILTPMKEGKPFEKNVSGNVRKLGHLILLGGLFGQVFANIAKAMMMNRYFLGAFGSLFKEGAVRSIRLHYTFSLTFVFVALLVYLLSYVFEYGEVLQTESDETL